MKLYKDLRGELHANDMTQAYLAKQFGCCTETISKMFRGQTSWPLDYCYKILSMLNKPYTDLTKYFPPEGQVQPENADYDGRTTLVRRILRQLNLASLSQLKTIYYIISGVLADEKEAC